MTIGKPGEDVPRVESNGVEVELNRLMSAKDELGTLLNDLISRINPILRESRPRAIAGEELRKVDGPSALTISLRDLCGSIIGYSFQIRDILERIDL